MVYQLELLQNRENPNRAHPIIHAGHQTHHTTTCVHIPQTSHPNAACVRIVSTDTPVYQQPPRRTTGGERRFRSTSPIKASAYRIGALMEGLTRLTKLRGVQSKPIMNESEKFRVARVERKRPRRRREKDFIRRYCWGLGVNPWVSKTARSSGRTKSTTMKV